MLISLFLLTSLLNVIHGLSDGNLFIKDMMELSVINQCSFGYMYEYGAGGVQNEHFELLNQRYNSEMLQP